MDYACGGSRKSKKDLKRKRQFRVFKRGGSLRGVEVNQEKK